MMGRSRMVQWTLCTALLLGCGSSTQMEMTVDATDSAAQDDGQFDGQGLDGVAVDLPDQGALEDSRYTPDLAPDSLPPIDLSGETADLTVCAPDDSDCDGVADAADNCPELANDDQSDLDDDGQGDACDADDDGDGYDDDVDLFPSDPTEWADSDGDGIGDNSDEEECDGLDNDGDGEIDEELPTEVWYMDPDEDGYYGEDAEETDLCGAFPGFAQEPGDCEPDAAAAHPGAEEICDLLDNDCNGEVDEGFDYVPWYPDNDGDGFGASGGSDCSSLLKDGNVEDGFYDIWPDGIDGPKLSVYCDMTTDGGGWTRIFFHDVASGYFASDEDAHEKHVGEPGHGQYSILSSMESFRSSDGTLEMRINWPDTSSTGRNIWRQTSNPTTAPVAGYEAISIDHTNQFWGGIELSDRPQTYLDGSVNHNYWFYSIGSQTPWNGGIPAYADPAARVALWVRTDAAGASEMAMMHCQQPEGYVAEVGDCDDGNGLSYPGAEEICDGQDNNCDGQMDEECPFGDLSVTQAPAALQFYARDLESNLCTVTVKGATEGVATEVMLLILRDGEPYSESEGQGSPFSVEAQIESGLHLYEAQLAWDNGTGYWKSVASYPDIVCGDVFVIDGQSNAVAKDYHNEGLGNAIATTFVRSWGSSVNGFGVVDDTAFGIALGDPSYTHAAIGQWGLQLAVDIVESQAVPVLVFNGAVGGTKVEQHQRNDFNPTDLTTIYGRLLWRVQQAGLTDAVRAIFWHQGESDGGMAYDTYLGLWTSMYEDWLEDYPNVEGIYTFQVRAGCGNPTWNRNVHRDLPGLLDKVIGHMSTAGVDGHDNCHFFHSVYTEWGHRMARLVRRDLYGETVEGHIEAPDPVSAAWLDATHLEIDFGDSGGGLELQTGAEAYFSLSDGVPIASAEVVGNTVVLATQQASSASWVSFVDVPGDIPWLVNDLGVGAFAWYELPIVP